MGPIPRLLAYIATDLSEITYMPNNTFMIVKNLNPIFFFSAYSIKFRSDRMIQSIQPKIKEVPIYANTALICIIISLLNPFYYNLLFRYWNDLFLD